ncbi:sodium:proton antiporter [Limibacter armeniacum]|uniref:cation:proton antiporter n=1 Tax=Limibacter armeniacum TaxID=466084 RepID=UPI002FE552BD
MIEAAGILVLGFFAQWLSWRIKIPAILPLIIIGLLVGPISTFLTANGHKFIDGDKIFHQDLLFDVVSISVGLILFEGGLTLKFKEIRTLANTVRNLIFFGTVITLLGGGFAVHWIMGFSYQISFLFGALIIVSGPTVIGPILRNVRANNNINTILKWEGILIDPVGALVAILIYEFIITGQSNEHFTIFALKGFLMIILAGLVTGGIFAWLTYIILKRNLVPHYLRNTVMLGIVILTFAVSDTISAESGLLAVTVLGMILGNLKMEQIKHILSFKEDVSIILISFLFVMLSSRTNVDDLAMLLDYRSLLLFLVIIFVLRPLVVFLSTIGSTLNWRERLFIAYICPRGIVAAGVASIFSVKLSSPELGILSPEQSAEAAMLLPLTFMTIVGTVIQQGLTAKPLVKFLGVGRSEPNGILFLGANEAARFMARYLRSKGISVMLGDTSVYNIREAKNMLLPVYEGSLLSDEALEKVDFSQFGQLLSTTSNTDINILANKIIGQEIGDKNVFRLPSERELKVDKETLPPNLLFNATYDFIGITQIFRKRPKIMEKDVNSMEEFQQVLEENDKILPLFILKPGHRAEPVTPMISSVTEGDRLVYINL